MDIPFLIFTLLQILVILSVMIAAVTCTVWFARRVRARMESHGGPQAAPQPLADVIQQLRKEEFRPGGGLPLIYLAAPCLAVIPVFMTFAVIPFGPEYEAGGINLFQIADLDIGVLFLLALSSMGVYGIALAGWDSHGNDFLPGGLRGSAHLRNSAQMLSYGLVMALSIVGVVLLTGSLSLRIIVESQAGTFWRVVPDWNIIPQLIGFFCFFTGAIAVSGRLRFERPENGAEMIVGYHTDYRGKRFAIYFLAEYATMMAVACIGTVLYFGGWYGPAFGPEFLRTILPLFWFASKVASFLFVYIWIRETLPRFRFDQWMGFSSKFLVPLAAANLVLTGFVLALRYG